MIHNAMLILFHFDNAVQGAVLFKLRGDVGKTERGQFSFQGTKQDARSASKNT